MEQLELNIDGIRCDNEACTYHDDTVKVEDYAKWVNKPCPFCSSNLLTEADYNNVQELIQTTQMINSMSPEQLQALVGHIDTAETVQMIIEINGTGKMDFKIQK